MTAVKTLPIDWWTSTWECGTLSRSLSESDKVGSTYPRNIGPPESDIRYNAWSAHTYRGKSSFVNIHSFSEFQHLRAIITEFTWTIGLVESWDKASKTETLVLRCCGDPSPPTYLKAQERFSFVKISMRVWDTLKCFTIVKSTKFRCSPFRSNYAPNTWAYLPVHTTQSQGVARSCDNVSRRFQFVEGVLSQFSSRTGITDHLSHST